MDDSTLQGNSMSAETLIRSTALHSFPIPAVGEWEFQSTNAKISDTNSLQTSLIPL